MRVLRPACEDEMVATFLAGEVASTRFGPAIGAVLDELGQSRHLVDDPDVSDKSANLVRRRILAAYRDYPAGGVFTGMPDDIAWQWVALSPGEVRGVRYLDWPYWTDFSGGSRLVIDGASRLGAWQRQPPGTSYRRIAEDLRAGRLPPPVILLGEPGPANLVVLEGHVRLTGLLICPQWLPPELEVLLGTTAHHDK
jgi:hypothetical protein